VTKIRTGQAPAPLTREQFHERFNVRLYDPAFEAERKAITRLEAIAWEALQEGRKSPITRTAGRGFADPGYEVPVQWLDTGKRLQAAQMRWSDRDHPGAACGYRSPSPLKLMIDRMVCADGGNPDPTTTHGKHVAEAKCIGQHGWDYPRHVDGRAYGVVVHGDVAGVESHRRNLTDGLEWMGLIDAGAAAERAGRLSQPDRQMKWPRTK
jgi:hypothetical protein